MVGYYTSLAISLEEASLIRYAQSIEILLRKSNISRLRGMRYEAFRDLDLYFAISHKTKFYLKTLAYWEKYVELEPDDIDMLLQRGLHSSILAANKKH